MSDEGIPYRGKNSALTDYERFAQQRKRYVAAKREARLLKRQGDAAAEGGLLEHPWLAAARRSKHEEERPDPFRSRQPARSTTRRLIGAAIVLCLWLAAYGAWQSMDRSGEPSAAPESRPVFRVWHSLDGAEEAALADLAAAYVGGRFDVAVSHHPDIPRSLSLLSSPEKAPHIAILPLTEARILAAWGIVEPLDGAENPDSHYRPLVDPVPWSVPIVAVVLNTHDSRFDARARREFVSYLQKRLGR